MNELINDNQDASLLDTSLKSQKEAPQYQTPEMHPIAVLAVCLAFFMVGNLLCGGIIIVLAKLEGLDFTELLNSLNENSPIGSRNFIRTVLFLNHVFSFILPAILTTLFVYKIKAVNYLKIDKFPNITTIGRAFLLLVVSIPLVQYSYLLNKMIPLPQWMKGMEQDTTRMLEAIITKEHWYEAVVNVFLIGVIPAIGEEMMFRGILQQQIGRLLKNEHVMVWLSAAIFSAIHFQFEGFFARMILGAILGYLFVWTRNLWIPMIVHLLNNSIQVIAIYAANIKPSEMDKMGGEDQMTWWMALISLILVIFVGNLIRKDGEKDVSINALKV
jgi:uncharacterized protein